jgi:transcriptional regulator with XRE-family HTH domain
MSIQLHDKIKIDMISRMTIPDLLDKHFLEWQLRTGNKRRPLKEFAEYIGVGDSMLNQVINNHRKPTIPFIIRCATILNDPQFYELSGIMPPSSPVFYIQDNIKRLTPEQQNVIKEQVSQYLVENEKGKTP